LIENVLDRCPVGIIVDGLKAQPLAADGGGEFLG
jgi:hypothetical protein